jgi:formate hydrogenlyase subunit 5
VPDGHPRLAPLVRPASPEPRALPRHVTGYGMFTIPHGPVRSGVLESIEYLVETPGEAIPHLNMRVFYKHRGVQARFAGMPPADAVLLAERTEGIASVAHALAFSHAVEQIAGCEPPATAQLIRVLHAELERIANHLDVAVRLADAAGLAVATARFALHKERVMRLVSRLCGGRFGRGVVVPGGVSAPPLLPPAQLRTELGRLANPIAADADALMATSSFLDRLRGTGPLTPGRARQHGALGPIGKAAGFADDARLTRPYDAYRTLAVPPAKPYTAGDALARLRVRWEEVDQSFRLLRQVADDLAERAWDLPSLICEPARQPARGRAVGWAEAPQGEVLYDVSLEAGRITRCHPRSASFHNLVLMHEVFAGDILTDFPFIEASFGLSVAGVAL